MANSVHQQYLENEILTSDPVKLVTILYRAALEAVGAARRHLASGKIAERSRQITRAAAILNELMRSLDLKRGGDLSHTLAELYDYMQRKLIVANVEQVEAPLIEVQQLMATLLEAWQQQAVKRPAPAVDHEPISCIC